MRRLTRSTFGLVRWCTSIIVPSMGESVAEGKVQSITVAVGDAVRTDQIIANIGSEKSDVDVRAPHDGIITSIAAAAGDVRRVGETIATLKKAQVDAAPVKPSSDVKPSVETSAPSTAQTSAPPPPPPQPSAPSVPAPTSTPRPSSNPTQAATVSGKDPRTRVVPLTPMRRRIAERLKASQFNAAMLTTFNEIDMTALIELRNKHKDDFLKQHGAKLGFMSPFMKACATVLRAMPIMNATYTDEGIEFHDFVDISVAVASPKGLIVPVVRDVQKMGLADIEKTIEDFAIRSKDGKVTAAEMSGGTFTISNGGTFGSWMGTPIINPPQSAILGMHAVKKRPWVVDDQIVVRNIMAVALTYDHRLIDGREAVTFLVKVKSIIEDPERLLLDLV